MFRHLRTWWIKAGCFGPHKFGPVVWTAFGSYGQVCGRCGLYRWHEDIPWSWEDTRSVGRG